MGKYSFGSHKALLQRLKNAIQTNEKVTFLVGSGLTCAVRDPYSPGVLSVSEIVDDIKKNLTRKGAIDIFNEAIVASEGENEYQVAMRTLFQCAGQDELNKVISNAVLAARINQESLVQAEKINQESLESDHKIWNIRPGINAIARLQLEYKAVFEGPILTTNFDPLLEIAIRRNGGNAYTLFLTNDGSFSNIIANNSIGVIHLHGYWHGSDTLHTSDQITKDRPLLNGALRKMLTNHTLCVLGYGGWNDVLTNTLFELAKEGENFKNILWCFFNDDENQIIAKNKELLEGFSGTINQRVALYKGIVPDIILPKLLANTTVSIVEPIAKINAPTLTFVDTEFPPTSYNWSGRASEMELLSNTKSKVVFITGIGGQGKTALAAHYISERFDATKWELWDWRDCKEESNRLNTKLLSIIENLTNGKIRAFEIADETTPNLVELLFDSLDGRRIIFVFDNVDQYIDGEKFLPSGSLDILYQKIIGRIHNSQFIFTCRPEIRLASSDVVLIPLQGLTLSETVDLFNKSKITQTISLEKFIFDAHSLTDGHPLLLNIIIGQVQRDFKAGQKFLIDIQENKNTHTLTIADMTIKSAWLSLSEKQQTLLRGIAENVRPESEEVLMQILDSELNQNQFAKALRTLKSLNLIVQRLHKGQQRETIDLHPLVKHFIKDQYPRTERSKYITLFVKYYDSIVVVLKKSISSKTPLHVFEAWTNKIELEINKDDFKSALSSLQEIEQPILGAGFHEEYLRISLKFFGTVDWKRAIMEEYRYFHEQLKEFIYVAIHMGRSDVETFLEQYVNLIPGKGYIILRIAT